jgi:HK97 family phage major capsid protein/HK97 family phage prohead protease
MTTLDTGQRVRRALAGDRSVTVTRAVPLNDIRIRRDGKGRTVDAYAAVFMTPTEIVDTEGHYMEQNDPGAFNNTLATRRDKIFCIYNHGRTLQGTPSDLYSVPVGTPTLSPDGRPTPLADERGLFTSTIYNTDPEADRILEAIRSGSLRGMSYTGVFLRSVPPLSGARDFYSPDKNGELTLVTRMEIALIEYGATPIPAYDAAAVVGVRNRESVTLNGASSRASAVEIHHTPTNYSGMWLPEETLDQMDFPAPRDQMAGMFTLYDDDTVGAVGPFPRTAGYLPHHDVGGDGKPGAANAAGVSQCLAEFDTLPDTYEGSVRHLVRAHLLAHEADYDSSKFGVSPAAGQALGQSIPPGKLTDNPDQVVSASGRGPDGAERMVPGTATIANHGSFSGAHVHAHEAHDGPDPDKDGVHAHGHIHSADNHHMHSHNGVTPGDTVMVSSSGRYLDDEETERSQATSAVWDPDGDGDNDLTAAGDSDGDYWDSSGGQLQSVPGMPLGLSHGAITVTAHTHAHHANGGPDQDGDGIHAHAHAHSMDDNHNHHHEASGLTANPHGANATQPPGSGAGVPTPHGGDVPSANIIGSSGRHPDGSLRAMGAGNSPWGGAPGTFVTPGDTSKKGTKVSVADPTTANVAGMRPTGIVHDNMKISGHVHAHLSHGGPDADGDGVHAHAHDHNGDADHEHPHEGVVDSIDAATSSSGRQAEEGAERADGPPKPYGNVTYADPKNGKYPIDTKAHAQAAWSYINHPKNAAKYPLNGVSLSAVKAKIKAACKKFGITITDGDGGSGKNGSSSSSGRQPAALGTGPRGGLTAAPHQHPADHVAQRESGMTNAEAVRMTVGERIERQSAVRARLAEIDSEYMGAELPADTRTEWRHLQEELIIHQRAIKDAQERAHYLEMIAEGGTEVEQVDNDSAGYGYDDRYAPYGGSRTTSPSYDNGFDRSAVRSNIDAMRGTRGPAFKQDLGDSIYDLTAIRNRARTFDEVPHLYREYAMRAIERARFPTPDKSREDCQGSIERMLVNVDDDRGTLARRVLVTGSPLYDRAFGKALQAAGVGALSAEESRALQLGVDSAGGYAVPYQLDPTVILTSNGAINPLRQISRIEQIVGKEWDGVTSAGVTVARVAEGTEAASGDASFVQPKVRTTRVQGFVPFNIELDVSWGALRSQMTSLLMDAKDVEEATSFSMGNGTAPNAQGVVQYAHDNANTVSTAGTATLAIGDLYSLENNMAPRFRQQSAYLASKTTYNRFRQLFQAQASAAFDSWVRPSAGTPATFNGYPAYEQSQMGTTITSGSFIILQGDFSKFLIVDRVGMGIELIPHLFGPANRYPLGQRGILAIWFNNTQVLVGNAFRLLLTT